MLSNKP